jgi:hypothetical protein
MLGRWLAGGSCAIAALTVVACASSTPADAPSRAARSPEPKPHGSLAACGDLPRSSGLLATHAHLTIDAPATAAAGQAVAAATSVTSGSTLPRVITTPVNSGLLVLRDGRVVARTVGPTSAPLIPLDLVAGKVWPAQAIPKSIRLVMCGADRGTVPLAPGSYTLVAVLGYQLDSFNAAPAGGTAPPPAGGRSFALVSAAVPLTVS